MENLNGRFQLVRHNKRYSRRLRRKIFNMERLREFESLLCYCCIYDDISTSSRNTKFGWNDKLGLRRS